jgi:hypothetical protein
MRFVEYIQSNGTQYIDTGFKPNQDTRVVMDAQYIADSPSENANAFFGVRTSASSKAYGVYWHKTNKTLYHFYNNGYNQLTTNALQNRQTLDANKNVFTAEGVTNTRAYGTFQCDYNMLLFAMNNAGSPAYKSYLRLYSCKVYDNGNLVRDYAPCVDDAGVACLYEKVSGTFVYNAGTGAFVAGDFIERVVKVFMPRIFEPPYVKWVPVTITGTGVASELYAIVNGIAYSEEASIKVLPGTTVTFYLTAERGSSGIYPAYLVIDGEETQVTSTSGYRQDYTVPDTVNAITIKFMAIGNRYITVTTS